MEFEEAISAGYANRDEALQERQEKRTQAVQDVPETFAAVSPRLGV